MSKTHWVPEATQIPVKDFNSKRISGDWAPNNTVFMIAQRSVSDGDTGRGLYRLHGVLVDVGKETLTVSWKPLKATENEPPILKGPEVFNDFVGAALTGHAFDRVTPGLGMWLVTISCWLFAISTLISWSSYGEQGIVYLLGSKAIMPYKLVYCSLILVATCGVIRTDIELDSITALGTGVMLWANIPIMWIFGRTAMKAYFEYVSRLDKGQMTARASSSLVDMVEGRD